MTISDIPRPTPSHLESICMQILTDCQNLHEAVIIVPSYNLVSTIGAALHHLSGSAATMLPKFFTLEAFYKSLRTAEGSALHEASSAEKLVILGCVLKEQNINLDALDEYFANIENYASTQSHSHTLLKVRDIYLNTLKQKSLTPPSPLNITEINWILETFTGKLLIIPTLENFSELSRTKACLLPLPPLAINGVLPELESLAEGKERYLAPKPEIEIIEYSNKFELVRAAEAFEQDYIIVESDDIRDLIGKTETLSRTHEFKLFYAIAKLAFDFNNLDYIIELALNPISILHNPNLSWLRNHGDLRSAHTIAMEHLRSHIRTLERINKIVAAPTYASAISLHHSILLELANEAKGDPRNWFELQQFLQDLKVYLSENQYKLDKDYLNLIYRLASRHSIATNSHNNMITLKHADYLDLDKVVLIENGFSKLEKAAQEEGEKEFKNLCTRLIWLMGAKKLTVLRVRGAACQESIFYSLLKSQYQPTQHKTGPYKKHPHPQPYVSIPQELRPKKYSVTAITKLIADPYAYYAEYLLNLRRYDRIWESQENRDFGILVHNVLAKLDDESAIEDALKAYDLTDSAKLIWREKLVIVVDFIKAYYTTNPVSKYFSECRGESSIGELIVTARADRIDLNIGGDATVIDIKTGYAPSQADVDKGIAPQLPIESWILNRGGFSGIAKCPTTAKYFAVNGRLNGQNIRTVKLNDYTTEASLITLLESFYAITTPYFATPVTGPLSYTHLKRLDEWFEIV